MMYQPQKRFFFNALGNWIESSEWFPVEFNVPDALSSFGQGVSNFGSNLGQGLPFINRLPSNVRPRPLGYVVLMPVQEQLGMTRKLNYNPFDGDDGSNSFPAYP